MKSNTFKVKFFLILFVFHLFSFEALSENTEREVMTSYEIMKTLPYSKINDGNYLLQKMEKWIQNYLISEQ